MEIQTGPHGRKYWLEQCVYWRKAVADERFGTMQYWACYLWLSEAQKHLLSIRKNGYDKYQEFLNSLRAVN